jgi:hypothetical protein
LWENFNGSRSQPLFDGGTLRHRQQAAEQALIQAASQYQSTVLMGKPPQAAALSGCYHSSVLEKIAKHGCAALVTALRPRI